MKFNYDDWEQPREPSDAYERITRPDRRERPEEIERRFGRRGKPMTDAEFSAFEARGKKINYCEERLKWQRRNDRQYEKYQKRHQLMETVLDCLAEWDSSAYLEKHRRTVRTILMRPRNQRRRELRNISTKLRRHQHTIRLVSAVAFDEISQAEYCREHKLDPGDASRMLAHLYEKELGLADAIGAICACAAMTSWQNRQGKRRRRYKGEGGKNAKLVFGFDYNNVAERGEWLADTSASSRKSYTTGAAASIADVNVIPNYMRNDPIRPETGYAPSKPPFDLHEPATWYASANLSIPPKQRLPLHYWDALYEPMRTVRPCEPRFDRYRETKANLEVSR